MILLTGLTVALLIGVTLTLITVQGYTDAENKYVTRVTLSKKTHDNIPSSSSNNMALADVIKQSTINANEVSSFMRSKYVDTAVEPINVPVASTLMSYENLRHYFFNVGAVVKISEIETIDIPNPDKVADYPNKMIVVYYEPLYTFFGSALVDTVMIFFEYENMYSDMPSLTSQIKDNLQVDKTYLIKADTMLFTSNQMIQGFLTNQEILPYETWIKLRELSHVIICGMYYFDPDRFIPIDVSTPEEAENHPLVKRASSYQHNFNDWPNGIMHMSIQLVQDLKNIKPFFNQDLVLTQGHYFSEDEIKNGDSVIIISEDTLKLSYLNIGDKAKIMLNQNNEFITDLKEYEIIGAYKSNTDYSQRIFNSVGQYTGNPITYEYNGKAYVNFMQGNGNLIFMPEASTKNDPLIVDYVNNSRLKNENGDPLILLDDFYFTLKNNHDLKAFIEELESSDYIYDNFDIAYEDQGYSKAVEILDQLRITSVVVILTAFAVTGVTSAFLMLLFVSRRSRDVIIMMSLGTKKGNICMMLAGSLLVMYIISCVSGLIIGSSIIETVLNSVISPLYIAEEFPQFLLKPAPIIQPHLNTIIPNLVYVYSAGVLLVVMVTSFMVSVIGKLRHKPLEILSDAAK